MSISYVPVDEDSFIDLSPQPATLAISYRHPFEATMAMLGPFLEQLGWTKTDIPDITPGSGKIDGQFYSTWAWAFKPATAPPALTPTAGRIMVALFNPKQQLINAVLVYNPYTETPDDTLATAKFGGNHVWLPEPDWPGAAGYQAQALAAFTSAIGMLGLSIRYTQNPFAASTWDFEVGQLPNDWHLFVNATVAIVTPYSWNAGYAYTSVANPTITLAPCQYTLVFQQNKYRQFKITLYRDASTPTAITTWLGLGSDYVYYDFDYYGNPVFGIFYNQNFRDITQTHTFSPINQHMTDPVFVYANAYQMIVMDSNPQADLGMPVGDILGGTGFLVTSPAIPDHQRQTVDYCVIFVGAGNIKSNLTWWNPTGSDFIGVALGATEFRFKGWPQDPGRVSGFLLPPVVNSAYLTAQIDGSKIAWPAFIVIPNQGVSLAPPVPAYANQTQTWLTDSASEQWLPLRGLPVGTIVDLTATFTSAPPEYGVFRLEASELRVDPGNTASSSYTVGTNGSLLSAGVVGWDIDDTLTVHYRIDPHKGFSGVYNNNGAQNVSRTFRYPKGSTLSITIDYWENGYTTAEGPEDGTLNVYDGAATLFTGSVPINTTARGQYTFGANPLTVSFDGFNGDEVAQVHWSVTVLYEDTVTVRSAPAALAIAGYTATAGDSVSITLTLPAAPVEEGVFIIRNMTTFADIVNQHISAGGSYTTSYTVTSTPVRFGGYVAGADGDEYLSIQYKVTLPGGVTVGGGSAASEHRIVGRLWDAMVIGYDFPLGSQTRGSRSDGTDLGLFQCFSSQPPFTPMLIPGARSSAFIAEGNAVQVSPTPPPPPINVPGHWQTDSPILEFAPISPGLLVPGRTIDVTVHHLSPDSFEGSEGEIGFIQILTPSGLAFSVSTNPGQTVSFSFPISQAGTMLGAYVSGADSDELLDITYTIH